MQELILVARIAVFKENTLTYSKKLYCVSRALFLSPKINVDHLRVEHKGFPKKSVPDNPPFPKTADYV